MPFDIIGWTEATPGTGTVKIAAGLGDNFYTVNGDDIQVRADARYLLGLFSAAASTGGRTRLAQPSLSIDYEFLKCQLSTDLDPIQGYTDLFGRPLPLVPGEKLNAYLTNATDEDALIAAIVGSGRIPQSVLDQVSPTHSISGYADTTITAFTWSPVTITWNQDLPKGRYAVVGMRVGLYVASIEAAIARLTGLKGPGAAWRPGVICASMEADHEEYQSITHEPWTKWPLMPEISFQYDQLPNIEVLMATTAATDENIELLLQKIA